MPYHIRLMERSGICEHCIFIVEAPGLNMNMKFVAGMDFWPMAHQQIKEQLQLFSYGTPRLPVRPSVTSLRLGFEVSYKDSASKSNWPVFF